MIKSIPIPLLLGKVEHYNITPLTAKVQPCAVVGRSAFAYTLNRKGTTVCGGRAVGFAVSVLDCPKRKRGAVFAPRVRCAVSVYSAVNPIATAFTCICFMVFCTACGVTPRWRCIRLRLRCALSRMRFHLHNKCG